MIEKHILLIIISLDIDISSTDFGCESKMMFLNFDVTNMTVTFDFDVDFDLSI